jgi:hypothetical protein
MTPQEETIVSVTEDADLIIGVDTHLDTHTAAICDARGRAVSQLQVAATTAGYEQLLAWVRSAAKATPTGSPPMPRYRQILHRLWIAAGNEALAYTQATGQPVRADKTWANLLTCATTSPTPGSPTSTKVSSAGSPGAASTSFTPPPSTTCKYEPSHTPRPGMPPTDHHPPAAHPDQSTSPLRK